MATGVGIAAVGSALPAFADHHSHPTPQSLTYLDRKTYVKNMEVIAHILPGEDRGGKMQFMSVGNRRYLLQQGDVIDISDLRKPQMFNKGGFQGSQLQVAYNSKLKKWILMTGAQAPITDSTESAPMGKYDDPHLADRWRNFKRLARSSLLRRQRSRKDGKALGVQHRRHRLGHSSKLLRRRTIRLPRHRSRRYFYSSAFVLPSSS